MKNYYRILGISRSATQEDIKKAYKEKISTVHPDKNTSSDEAQAAAAEINEAFSYLKNKNKRNELDYWLALREEPPPIPVNSTQNESMSRPEKANFLEELKNNPGLVVVLLGLLLSISYTFISGRVGKSSEIVFSKTMSLSKKYKSWISFSKEVNLSTRSRAWESFFKRANKYQLYLSLLFIDKVNKSDCLKNKEKSKVIRRLELLYENRDLNSIIEFMNNPKYKVLLKNGCM